MTEASGRESGPGEYSKAGAARSIAWPIAFAVVGVAALMTFAGLYVFHSIRQLPADAVETGREVLSDLRSVAEAFRQGTVETTFISYAARVSGSSLLQVAHLVQTEVYTRQDSETLLWGNLQLPDVVVAAIVPVEYTFHVDLDDSWQFSLEDGVLQVVAPEIGFNTPALDVSRLRFDIRESSLLRDEEAAIEALKAGLSELSRRRAREHISLVRETARRRTEDLVGTWLAGAFGDAESYRVEVLFTDEVPTVEGFETAGD